MGGVGTLILRVCLFYSMPYAKTSTDPSVNTKNFDCSMLSLKDLIVCDRDILNSSSSKPFGSARGLNGS
jgi:hypothetical protein